MDGYTLLTSLHQAIGESSTSTWPNVKLSYEHLYKAAVATADKTGILTTYQTITTVAAQYNYKLNADFLRLFLKDDQNRWFVEFDNGTSTHFLYFVEYDAIKLNSSTASIASTAALGGSILLTTFTDTTHGTGRFRVGQLITGTGVTTGTYITALGTGTGSNSGGTYTVNNSQTVTAQTITGTVTTALPNWFSIRDASQVTQITGSASATGSQTSSYTIHGETCGETILTTATAILGPVCVGDIVHNTTDGSHGIVVALSDTSNVVCALFGGTLNCFTSGDAFIINPQMRYELVLDPPPTAASSTVTVWYVRKPNPVYSAYRRYDFPNEFTGLVDRASFDYRYRDQKPDFGDRQYRNWEMECRSLGRDVNRAKRRRGFYVNFSKPADASFTFRR